MRAKVMVVDDEIGILKLIKDYLVFNEYGNMFYQIIGRHFFVKWHRDASAV